MFRADPIEDGENKTKKIEVSGNIVKNSGEKNFGSFSLNISYDGAAFEINEIDADSEEEEEDEDFYYMPSPQSFYSESKQNYQKAMATKCHSRVNVESDNNLNINLDKDSDDSEDEEDEDESEDEDFLEKSFTSYLSPSKAKQNVEAYLNENSEPPSCESLPSRFKQTNKPPVSEIDSESDDSLSVTSVISRETSSQAFRKPENVLSTHALEKKASSKINIEISQVNNKSGQAVAASRSATKSISNISNSISKNSSLSQASNDNQINVSVVESRASIKSKSNISDNLSKNSSNDSLVKKLTQDFEAMARRDSSPNSLLDLSKKKSSNLRMDDIKSSVEKPKNVKSTELMSEIEKDNSNYNFHSKTSTPSILINKKLSSNMISPVKIEESINACETRSSLNESYAKANLAHNVYSKGLIKNEPQTASLILMDFNNICMSPKGEVISKEAKLTYSSDTLSQLETGKLSSSESKLKEQANDSINDSRETLTQIEYSIGSIGDLKLIDSKQSDKKSEENEDLEITMKFAHGNGKVSESKFTLYNDETEKHYTSEYLPNLKADIKRKLSDDLSEDGTKVLVRLYKTVQEHDGEAAKDKEVFLGRYELILNNNERKKKYKFHDIGKENLITVKLSRNYSTPWKKVINKWQ